MTPDNDDLESRIERIERILNVPERDFKRRVEKLSEQTGLSVEAIHYDTPGRTAELEAPTQIDKRLREKIKDSGFKWAYDVDRSVLEVWGCP